MTFLDRSAHIPKFGQNIWYINKGAGDDTNSGTRPDDAFETIGAGILAMADGEALSISAGTYVEIGLNLLNDAAEMWFEIGTIIIPATGTSLIVSGDYCLMTGGVYITPAAGQIGLQITGDFARIGDVGGPSIITGGTGIQVTGTGCVIRNPACGRQTVKAYDLQGDQCRIYDGATIGVGATIGYHINSGANVSILRNCVSMGHATAGFQIDALSTNIVCKSCISGGGDGHYIDNGINTHLEIEDHDSREKHEHTYPTPDGEGVAGDPVIVQSEINDETGANTTANYFGDVAILVDVNVIATDWFFKGVNVFATTASDDQRFQVYRVEKDIASTRNGGNNWDEGVTDLTFADASDFAIGDLIWIESPNYVKTDNAKGEIVEITNIVGNVVTIARQTEASGRTGLHWNHTTNDAGNEVVYLCWRDENKFHFNAFDHSASGGKDFTSILFAEQRRLHINDGLIVRMINGTDASNSLASLTVKWSD